jgi:hypothetical protein
MIKQAEMSHLRFPTWQFLVILASNLANQNHDNRLPSGVHIVFVTLSSKPSIERAAEQIRRLVLDQLLQL